MIGKIKYGSSFNRVIEYSLQSHKGELLSKNMVGRTPSELTKEFQFCSSLNSRTEKPCSRFIIGISQYDAQKLNKDQLKDIVNLYLKKMGYENHPYLAALHTDTQNRHIHLITSRINPISGKAVSSSYDFIKSRQACREIEELYDLTRTREKANEQTKAKSYNHEKRLRVEYNPNIGNLNQVDYNTAKSFLKFTVNQALSGCNNERQLNAKLLEKGIELKVNSAGNGYSFNYMNTTFKASEISRDLSYSNLQKRFSQETKIAKEEINQNKERIKMSSQEYANDLGIDNKSLQDALNKIGNLKKENEINIPESKNNKELNQGENFSYGI